MLSVLEPAVRAAGTITKHTRALVRLCARYPTDMISHSQATPASERAGRRQQTTPLSINIQRRYLHDECAERCALVRRMRVIAMRCETERWWRLCQESAARRVWSVCVVCRRDVQICPQCVAYHHLLIVCLDDYYNVITTATGASATVRDEGRGRQSNGWNICLFISSPYYFFFIFSYCVLCSI